MEARNRRRLVLALAILIVALVVVLVRNRDFWFSADENAESEAAAPVSAPAGTTVAKVTPPATTTVAPVVPATTAPAPASPAPAAKQPAVTSAPKTVVATPSTAPAPKKNTEVAAKAPAASIVPKAEAAPAAPTVAPTRTQLPPMEVEVVAGDSHHSLKPGSNTVLVEIPTHSNSRATVSKTFQWNPMTNAAEITRLSSDLPERVAQAEEASYPSLAKQMKVQGSVILQAYVGADGGIKDLHVLSGNPILVSAAVEAARQWRFAPYMQNGQAVETQAKIQVNFSIKVL